MLALSIVVTWPTNLRELSAAVNDTATGGADARPARNRGKLGRRGVYRAAGRINEPQRRRLCVFCSRKTEDRDP